MLLLLPTPHNDICDRVFVRTEGEICNHTVRNENLQLLTLLHRHSHRLRAGLGIASTRITPILRKNVLFDPQNLRHFYNFTKNPFLSLHWTLNCIREFAFVLISINYLWNAAFNFWKLFHVYFRSFKLFFLIIRKTD